MAGEVTESSAILQARLTDTENDQRVSWRSGVLNFEVSSSSDFTSSSFGPDLVNSGSEDGIVKYKLRGLKSGQTYYYRAHYGLKSSSDFVSKIGKFRTLQGIKGNKAASFCVFSCLGYEQFYQRAIRGTTIYQGPDAALGYPVLETMLKLDPDFAVGTGDIVYYDQIARPHAKTAEEMRRLWHEQAILPRMKRFVSNVATYWQKDDHDYRFNDSSPHSAGEPSEELGRKIFEEQLPFPEYNKEHPYRTFRVSNDIQIWLTEGRDFRSPNSAVDGPDKSIWGMEQRKWLMQTLKTSNALHKVVINPTPLVGPDYKSKSDNHVNYDGFRYEGDLFRQFLQDNKLTEQVTLVCGDRHWPYYSISPEGIHELCAGTATEGNVESNLPRPGSKNSTDPKGRIDQRWIGLNQLASFIHIQQLANGAPILFRILSSKGKLLYTFSRTG